MAWLYLVLAGAFEVGFAISLKKMDDHRNIPWAISFYICVVLSFGLLQQAARTLPIGTAYAVWTGIGAVGTAVIGIAVFGEPATWARGACLAVLVAALIGLKLSTPPVSDIQPVAAPDQPRAAGR